VRQHTYPYAGPQNGYQNPQHNGYSNGDNAAPVNSHQQSYDGMTSGSEEYGKSTNPSSENSSFDQLHQLRTKPEDFSAENPYAKEIQFNQTSPTQLFTPQNLSGDGRYYNPDMQPPMIPSKEFTPPPANNPNHPIKLNSTMATAEITPPASPKRQSWIKRKFSKRAA